MRFVVQVALNSYVAQTDLELQAILLPWTLQYWITSTAKYWDYRRASTTVKSTFLVTYLLPKQGQENFGGKKHEVVLSVCQPSSEAEKEPASTALLLQHFQYGMLRPEHSLSR